MGIWGLVNVIEELERIYILPCNFGELKFKNDDLIKITIKLDLLWSLDLLWLLDLLKVLDLLLVAGP